MSEAIALVRPKSGDVPTLTEFDPTLVPYQYRVLCDIRQNFDYSNGKHEILLSGSVGSAKSLLLAHLAVTHCLMNKKARCLIARKTLPDLKGTIYQTIVEHLAEDLVEGVDYKLNTTSAKVTFLKTGSEIIARSWADKKYKKFRSLKLSMALFEELTENNDEDEEAYRECSMRMGRLQHVKENVMVSATNPDSPAHWVYGHFIGTKVRNRHVYYSVTYDNPFLDRSYIDSIVESLDEKQVRRMIYGEWLNIEQDVIYYAYSDANYRDELYRYNLAHPVHINFDFNIGLNKPFSACLHQVIPTGAVREYHFSDEVVVEGARTLTIMEEMADRGLLDHDVEYRVHGDASGRNRDTRSTRSDYDIITQFLANYRPKHGKPMRFVLEVPAANPRLRDRHNLVNGLMKNANGLHRLFVYRGAKKYLDEGFRLTALKKGADYIEDDSKPYQHVTTAAGYGMHWDNITQKKQKQSTIHL